MLQENLSELYSPKELKILSFIAFMDEYLNNPNGILKQVVLKYSDKDDITINFEEE